jgi:phosphoglucomutase
VIDSVKDYVEYMKEIFDFGAIRGLIQGTGGNPGINVLINAMNGGTYLVFCSN